MDYAFIKNKICVNVAVFHSHNNAMNFKQFSDCDNIISVKDGFGIGDKYESGEWTKIEQPPIEPLQEPTVEDYLIELDFRVSKIELGLEV